MDNYNLKADEVVLYKGNVKQNNKKGTTELILSNLNIVLINKCEKLFSKEEITVAEYPVNTIKMYEGKPQIKTKGNIAEIYLSDTEIEFEFNSKMELYKFTDAAIKLLTGESAIQRSAKKVKETIGLIDDTFGINTVQATGNILKNGIVGNISNAIGKIGNSIFNKKKN